jgi:hypothetical protein
VKWAYDFVMEFECKMNLLVFSGADSIFFRFFLLKACLEIEEDLAMDGIVLWGVWSFRSVIFFFGDDAFTISA